VPAADKNGSARVEGCGPLPRRGSAQTARQPPHGCPLSGRARSGVLDLARAALAAKRAAS
jgi:hypothetical protein